jgi:hypothetical protein
MSSETYESQAFQKQIRTGIGQQQQEEQGIGPSLYQNEEAFHTGKIIRLGFRLRENLLRNQQRLEIMLLIGALATCITWLVGTLKKRDQACIVAL